MQNTNPSSEEDARSADAEHGPQESELEELELRDHSFLPLVLPLRERHIDHPKEHHCCVLKSTKAWTRETYAEAMALMDSKNGLRETWNPICHHS